MKKPPEWREKKDSVLGGIDGKKNRSRNMKMIITITFGTTGLWLMNYYYKQVKLFFFLCIWEWMKVKFYNEWFSSRSLRDVCSVWTGTPIIRRCTCVRKKGVNNHQRDCASNIAPARCPRRFQPLRTFRRRSVFPHCVLDEKLIKGTPFSAVAIFILCVAARQIPSFLL